MYSQSYAGDVLISIFINRQVAVAHTAASIQKGWSLPEMLAPAEHGSIVPENAFSVKDMSPYWIRRDRAVTNSLRMAGMFVLTVRNVYIFKLDSNLSRKVSFYFYHRRQTWRVSPL